MTKKALPLTMGDKLVGYMKIDPETNKIEGSIDPNLVGLLDEAFGENLYEIAFMGKLQTSITPEELHKRLYEFVNDVEKSEG